MEDRVVELKRALATLAREEPDFLADVLLSAIDDRFAVRLLSRPAVLEGLVRALLSDREAVATLVRLLASDEEAVRAFALLALSNPRTALALLEVVTSPEAQEILRRHVESARQSA